MTRLRSPETLPNFAHSPHLTSKGKVLVLLSVAKGALAKASSPSAMTGNQREMRVQLVIAQTAITEALAITDAGLSAANAPRLEGVE